MLQRQKETILALLKSNEANKNYENSYWFSYRDFLDPTDDFTDFSCENLDGKQKYIRLIENLFNKDENANVFVEVYGYDGVNNQQFIYADTLIILSKLPLLEIEQIFNEPKDSFPSDIGEITDFSQKNFIINHNGDLLPAAGFCKNNYSAYYCWWD